MDRDALIERNRRSLEAFYRDVARGSDTSRGFETDGVFASIVRAVPDRSIVNAVVYEHADALAATLDDLAAAYEEAGVSAWMAWVPEDDAEAIRLLEGAGHHQDGDPRVMAMELSELRTPSMEGIDWTTDADAATVGRLNDLAYGMPEGTFAPALDRALERWHVHVARLEGAAVACVACVDVDGDCGVYLVATLPVARGRGLSTALMGQALADAAERGCTTTLLQASAMGRPIYARIGYEDFGSIQMWERRRPAAAAAAGGD